MENIIFKARVGSHAYGTNIEGSDEDFKGIYLQSPEDILENGYQEQICVNKDEVYYELRRFIELALTANPTMLELLFMPEDCIIYKHPVFDKLLEIKDEFLSKKCKHSFSGYAYSQIKKAGGLQKKMNWENSRIERKTVLDFCYVYSQNQSIPLRKWLKDKNYLQELCALTSLPHFRYMYNVYYDHNKDLARDNPRDAKNEDFTFAGIVSNEDKANDICLSEVPEWYRNMCEGLMYFNKDEYSVHCKDYLQYKEWLAKRNKQRYVDVEDHGQRIDGKNLLHCYRLLETGLEILKDHKLEVRRPNAQFLIEIRKGKHNLEELLKNAEIKLEELHSIYDSSTLRHSVDYKKIKRVVVDVRKEFYKPILTA